MNVGEEVSLMKGKCEKYLTVEGMKIRYLVKGAGYPILLIHGCAHLLETWDLNINPLSEHYQVYAIDLPGHGLSDKPGVDYSISFFTKFILSFMKALGIGHAHLVGHSLGGQISLNIAINFPDKVDCLILETAAGLSYDVSVLHRVCNIPVWSGVEEGELEVSTVIKQRTEVEFYRPDFVAEELIERAYRLMRQMPEQRLVLLSILRNSVNANGFRPEVVMIDRLHLVKSPTLLIHGAQDKIHSVELSQDASRLIPNARLAVINQCGHCVHIEKAVEFNKAVLSFLKTTQPNSLSLKEV